MGFLLLQEIINSHVDYVVTKQTNEMFKTQAEIGDRVIKFTAEYSNDNSWEVHFAEQQLGKASTFAKTGAGSELKVFSMVLDSFKEFIDRYAPAHITFTADKDGPSDRRAGVYRRLATKISSGYNGTEIKTAGATMFSYTRKQETEK